MAVDFPDEHTITVAKLIELLNAFPGDAPVVMSKDGEGNNFSPLADAEAASYAAESTWHGELADDESAAGVPVVCLWPVN